MDNQTSEKFNFGNEKGRNIREEETSNERFLNESEKLYSELDNYINTVRSFRESGGGLEISRNTNNIASIIDYLILLTEEDMIARTVEAYKESGTPYSEVEIRKIVSRIREKKVNDGKLAFKNLFPNSEIGETERDLMKVTLTDYLKSRGVNFSISATGEANLSLGHWPVDLQRDYGRGGGISEVNINEGKVKILEKEYELILRKYFTQLPRDSVLIYPAIGNDLIFYNIANELGHRVIGIDSNPNIKIPRESLVLENFESYRNLIEKLKSQKKVRMTDNLVLVFKGFDTIAELPEGKVVETIGDFDGKEIVLFGCGCTSMFGWGIPRLEGPAKNVLVGSQKFIDSTPLYFNSDSQQLMKKMTELSQKLPWTTGFFPATEIEIYRTKS